MELLCPDTLTDTESSLAHPGNVRYLLYFFKWEAGIEIKQTVEGAKLTGATDDQIKSLIEICVQKRCYYCAFTLALYCYEIEEAFRWIPDQEKQFWDTWMERFVLWSDWAKMRKVLSTLPTYNCSKFLGHSFKQFRLSQDSCSEAKTVVDTMLHRCSEADVPELVLLTFKIIGVDSAKFEMLLYFDNIFVRRAIWSLASAPHSVFRPNILSDLLQSTSCLSVARDAGLLAVARRALSDSALYVLSFRAVNHNEPTVVELFYDEGLLNNRSLFELSQAKSLEVDRHEENMKTLNHPRDCRCYFQLEKAKQIRDFLRSKAPQPRTLQTLCFLEVSKHVGWGCVRDGNVDSLPIPNGFRDKLKRKKEEQ